MEMSRGKMNKREIARIFSFLPSLPLSLSVPPSPSSPPFSPLPPPSSLPLPLFLSLSLSLSLFSSSACISLDPQRVDSAYYYEGRFNNLDSNGASAKSFWDVIKWQFFSREDPPTVEGLNDDPPQVRPLKREDLLAPVDTVRLVWLGHATVWIAVNYGGHRTHIITDPILGSPFPLQRLIELPIDLEKLPPVDIVTVSHAHRDHLDLDSLKFLQRHNPQVVIYMPDGSRELARDNDLVTARVIEWWQEEQFGPLTIEYAPSYHWSRLGLNDLLPIPWGSYLLRIGNLRIYFAGDTGYSSHFREIHKRYNEGFDAVLLPIGAFKPRWFMSAMHINPPEALLAAEELRAQMLLPIHWGTFNLGDDKPQEAMLYLKELLKESKQNTLLWQPGSHFDLQLSVEKDQIAKYRITRDQITKDQVAERKR